MSYDAWSSLCWQQGRRNNDTNKIQGNIYSWRHSSNLQTVKCKCKDAHYDSFCVFGDNIDNASFLWVHRRSHSGGTVDTCTTTALQQGMRKEKKMLNSHHYFRSVLGKCWFHLIPLNSFYYTNMGNRIMSFNFTYNPQIKRILSKVEFHLCRRWWNNSNILTSQRILDSV